MSKQKIQKRQQLTNIRLALERFEANPILRPDPNHLWETKAVFNPAAIYEDGKVHILYRAIGETDVSVLGYASSLDGLHIHERLDQPAYVPRESFEGVNPSHPYISEPTGIFTSGGGGLGGCEDPRLTRIGEQVYMTYVAYDGHSHPRVALSSIHIDNFLKQKWDWKKPVLISPPYIVDKNACILPEKINGKYWMISRQDGENILILNSKDIYDWNDAVILREPQYEWEFVQLGNCGSPIKTSEGWLVLTHSVGPVRTYGMSALLLDLKNPHKIIGHLKEPLLEPDEEERDGYVPNVVYSCGSMLYNEELIIPYGVSDSATTFAHIPVIELLNMMK